MLSKFKKNVKNMAGPMGGHGMGKSENVGLR
jgi:hypothetical protein